MSSLWEFLFGPPAPPPVPIKRKCGQCKHASRSGMYSGGLGSGSMYLDLVADSEPCIDHCTVFSAKSGGYITCAESVSNENKCGSTKKRFKHSRNNAPHRIGDYL
jgi:hypothetical protein